MVLTRLRCDQLNLGVLILFAVLAGCFGISQAVSANMAYSNTVVGSTVEPVIVSPREGELITRRSVRICARGLGNRFSVLVGNRDVTSAFRRKGRLWCARLRRGADVKVGSNRLVIEYSSNEGPRYAARTFVIGERAPGTLQLFPESPSDSLLHVHVEGPAQPFEAVEIKLNGRRVETADWVVGKRTPSTQWPLGAQAFSAMFGADNGLRHGVNRLKITAFRKDGSYDIARHRVFIPRSLPLVSAGEGRRVPVGRSIALAGSVKHRRHRLRHSKINLRWEIVDAPEDSTAELSDHLVTEPTFVPDVHGTYRFRLIAQVGSRSLRTTMDETTIEAKPSFPPIGVPITTITKDGGILVGDTAYPPGPGGPWAQVLVFDRRTLDLVQNNTVLAGPGGGVTSSMVNELANLVESQNASHLVVVSGGGRAIQFEQSFSIEEAMEDMLISAGVLIEPNRGTLLEHLKRGTWSLIGVPGVSGSGYLNLFGLDYGLGARDTSEPGALTGYLREDVFDNYGFASAAFETIDTQASGSTALQNVMEIGSQRYLSGQLGGTDYAGFHVLVLDSQLKPVHNETYQMNQGGTNNSELVNSMRLLLDNVAPGHLIVVQSIGAPFGFGPSWVADGPLFRNSFGDNENRVVPRASSTWFDAAGFGQSLAGIIGSIGGAAAHDHFAALNSRNRDGYTLIGSVGQLAGYGFVTIDVEPVPIDPGSQPVSHIGSIAKRTARVVGTLRRDRRALWHVLTPADNDSFENGAVETVLYQPETAWPLSTDTDDNNANCYIASQLFAGTGFTDVRTAYYEANLTAAEWNARLPSLTALTWNSAATCPSTNQTFTESAFNAVKSQLEIEFSKVADVTSLTADWTAIFGDATTTGYIDLQTIAHTVIGNIDRIDTSAQSTAKTEAIISDSLQVAGGLSFGIPPASAAFGAASGVFGLLADSSGNQSGRPSLSPLETEVSTLGQNLVSRYQEVSSNLQQIQAILVSDWGKLQQTDDFTAAWSPDSAKMTSTLTLSSKQEFYSALLPTIYILYFVNAEFIGSVFYPWNLLCQGNGSPTHPFGESNETPSAWSTPVIVSNSGLPTIIFLGINTVAEIDGGQLNRNPDRPDLANMGGDNLFQPLSADVGTAIGLNQTTLFADPRFVTRWFWCTEIEE